LFAGPNQIIPVAEYTATVPDGRVKLRIGESGIGAEPPISIPGLLNRTVTRHPDVIALAQKRPNGSWKKITFREYQQSIFTCAKGFLKLGLERHHSVAILGFNSMEWFISDLAAIHAG
jgi:long-chain-fatty-acid--CoA ligase ACSBG